MNSMKYSILSFIFALTFSNLSFGQYYEDITNYEEEEKTLAQLGQRILNAALFQNRDSACKAFKTHLSSLLAKDDSIKLPFDRVSNLMKVRSADSTIRILTWSLLDANNSYHYFGYVQRLKADGDYLLYELKDRSDQIVDPEKLVLSSENWWGSMYYDVALINNGLKDMYTILGWDGNNNMSHKKVIDIFYFDRDDSLRFGSPIIRDRREVYYRKIFEFSAEVSMQMAFQRHLNRIIFESLSPSNPSLVGVYEYYGPAFIFDAYNWGGRYWDYEADIDVEEGLEKKDKAFEVKHRDTIQSKNLFKPYGK